MNNDEQWMTMIMNDNQQMINNKQWCWLKEQSTNATAGQRQQERKIILIREPKCFFYHDKQLWITNDDN